MCVLSEEISAVWFSAYAATARLGLYQLGPLGVLATLRHPGHFRDSVTTGMHLRLPSCLHDSYLCLLKTPLLIVSIGGCLLLVTVSLIGLYQSLSLTEIATMVWFVLECA